MADVLVWGGVKLALIPTEALGSFDTGYLHTTHVSQHCLPGCFGAWILDGDAPAAASLRCQC